MYLNIRAIDNPTLSHFTLELADNEAWVDFFKQGDGVYKESETHRKWGGVVDCVKLGCIDVMHPKSAFSTTEENPAIDYGGDTGDVFHDFNERYFKIQSGGVQIFVQTHDGLVVSEEMDIETILEILQDC